MYFGLITSEGICFFLLWIVSPFIVLGGLNCWYSSEFYKHKYNSVVGALSALLIIFHLTGVFNIIEFANANWIAITVTFAVYILLAYPYTKHVSWKAYLTRTYQAYKQRIEDIRHGAEYGVGDKAANMAAAEREIEKYGYSKPISVTEWGHRKAFIDMMIYWPLIMVKDSLRTVFQGVRGIFDRIFGKFVTSLQKQAQTEFEKSLKE